MKPIDLYVTQYIQAKGVKTAFVTVTPELAQSWLEQRAPNRNPRDMRIARIARDIEADAWILTHQGICFRKSDGRIIDGQHRLEAIVRSGKPVLLLVTWDVSDEAMSVIDTGTSRGTADVMTISGIEHAKRKIALCRAVHSIIKGPGAGATITFSIRENEILIKYMEEPLSWALANFSMRSIGIDNAPVVAACMFAYYTDRERVQDFVNKLSLRTPSSTRESPARLRDAIQRRGKHINNEQDRSDVATLTLGAVRRHLRDENDVNQLRVLDREAVLLDFLPAWVKNIGKWPL